MLKTWNDDILTGSRTVICYIIVEDSLEIKLQISKKDI